MPARVHAEQRLLRAAVRRLQHARLQDGFRALFAALGTDYTLDNGIQGFATLTQREAVSPAWPQNLTPEKADCVLRLTRDRVAGLSTPRVATPMASFSDRDRLLSVTEYVFPIGHNSGKWYAEIQVNKALAGRRGSGQVHVGVDNVDGFYAISGDVEAPDDTLETFGLAIDLDENSM